MFDTILLLTEPTEQVALSPVLRAHNASLSVIALAAADEFRNLGAKLLGRSRLIAFATPVIVPASILSALGYGAFNFHPGPPAYPGWAPAHFALYEGAGEFGATLHAMTEKVDAGAILEARLFSIEPGMNILELEELTYSCLVRQFIEWAHPLATQPTLPTSRPPVFWGERKSSRRRYQALCNIPLDISKEDLERRMRVFGFNHFGTIPTVTLHGFQFRAAPGTSRSGPVQAG